MEYDKTLLAYPFRRTPLRVTMCVSRMSPSPGSANTAEALSARHISVFLSASTAAPPPTTTRRKQSKIGETRVGDMGRRHQDVGRGGVRVETRHPVVGVHRGNQSRAVSAPRWPWVTCVSLACCFSPRPPPPQPPTTTRRKQSKMGETP